MEPVGTISRRRSDGVDCGQCFMETRCWPESPPRTDSVEVIREPVLRRSEFLWRAGDAFRGLFLVRSGCIKHYQVTTNGEEQVLRFALPGDLLGLESLATGRSETHAVALTEAMVCRLTWPPADTDPAQSLQVERRLLRRASSLLRQHARPTRSADPAAALLAFLHDLAARMASTDGAAAAQVRCLRLPMSRLEIGQYLGCAEETVCRSFQRLQRQGAVTVSGRSVALLGAAAHPAAAP